MGTSTFKKYSWSKWSSITQLQNYVVLDVETTGLSPAHEEIIEIGMVKISGGMKNGEYSSFVNPGKPVPTRITKITGITNDDVICAPSFEEIAKDIIAFIGDSIVIAHNANFDLSFLVNSLNKCEINATFVYIDTLYLARKASPSTENHKLETLISELNIAPQQTHRALDDARCTLALFQKICVMYSDTKLMDAISSCCTPIEDYSISPKKSPLQGKTFVLVGAFTFSYSAAQKLITAAGGTLAKTITSATDYLVYGYQDPSLVDAEQYENTLSTANVLRTQEGKIQLINEVKLLQLCGVTFY